MKNEFNIYALHMTSLS